MKEIPLSNGGVAVVDDDAPAIVFQISWCQSRGYARGRASKKFGGDGRVVLMHHLTFGKSSDRRWMVDHINGNGLDNRRENLQLVTNSRNAMKGRTALGGGATFDRNAWAWRARTRVDGKLVDLGLHDTKDEALAAVRRVREGAWSHAHAECPEFA